VRTTRGAFVVGLLLVFVAVHLVGVARATDGLACEDFANPEWAGTAVEQRVVKTVDAETLIREPARGGARFSTECRGWLYVDTPNDYTFVLGSDDGAQIVLDDTTVLHNVGPHGLRYQSATRPLVHGAHALTVRYSQYGGGYGFVLLMAPGAAPPAALNADRLSRVPRVRMEALQQRWTPILVPLLMLGGGLGLLLAGRARLTTMARAVSAWIQRIHAHITVRTSTTVATLLGVAATSRLILWLCSYPIVWPDSFSYYDTALAILRGDWFSHEVFRTPLYPAFMAAFFVTGVTPGHGLALIATQHALGLISTLLIFDLARRPLGPGIAFYGALLWTLSPLTLYYETAVQTETLFVTLVVFVVWWAQRRVLTDARTPSLIILGAACGLATLTRPVGQAWALVIVGVVVWAVPRRRMATAALVLGAYAVTLLPWLYVNSQSYGFVGVSRGQGLGLFMRAFDVERLPTPSHTSFDVVLASHQRFAESKPFLHYAVRDDLNYHGGFNARQTDELMASFALEAIAQRPVSYATGVAYDWFRLFLSPHRSVVVCAAPTGAHLCTGRSDGQAMGPFANVPAPGFRALKQALTAYMDASYPLLALLGPLAAIGGWLTLRRARQPGHRARLTLMVATIVYFSAVAVAFNTVEDRYRLPADAFVMVLACAGIDGMGRASASIRRQGDERPSVGPANAA
jgi:hypothetical protein